jgi:hypothetical protein
LPFASATDFPAQATGDRGGGDPGGAGGATPYDVKTAL